MNISRTLFATVLGAVVAGSLGTALMLTGWTLLVVVPGLIGLCGLFAFVAYQVVHRRMVTTMSYRGRNGVAALLTAMAIADSVFGLAFVIQPVLWWAWWICLLVLAAAEYWVARSAQAMYETLPNAEAVRQERQERRERVQATSTTTRSPEISKLERALRKARIERDLKYHAHSYIGDNHEGIKYTVRVQSPLSREKADSKSAFSMGPHLAETLAVGFSEVFEEDARSQGHLAPAVALQSDWVSVDKEPWAGLWSITVNTADVMGRLYQYYDDITPASIHDPVEIGISPDGTLQRLLLTQHGNAVGQTRSGKTAFINAIIAYVTRCHDAVMWVGGTHKLYESIGQWIEPYRGTGLRPPFDWVAAGGQDVAHMLTSVMRLSDWRQSVPFHLRPKNGWKTIICLIDETSLVVEVEKWSWYQGKRATPGAMIARIIKAAASAGIFLVLAAQRGTLENWGIKGGDVIANMGWTAAFRSRDFAELGRQMGDYQLPIPKHQGELWLNPGMLVASDSLEPADDGTPKRLKTRYMQEEGKRRLHDGITERQVSWARRHIIQELPTAEQEVLAEPYLTRPTSADAQLAYLATLMGVAHDVTEQSAAEADGADFLMSLVNQAWGEPPVEPSARERSTPAPEPEPGGEARTTREAVHAELAAVDGPIGPKALAERLATQGINTSGGRALSPQHVQNILAELKDAGQADTQGRGQWVAVTVTEGATAS